MLPELLAMKETLPWEDRASQGAHCCHKRLNSGLLGSLSAEITKCSVCICWYGDLNDMTGEEGNGELLAGQPG